MPKILVTGGAGFIGSHLIDALVELGFRKRLRVVDALVSQVHGRRRAPRYLPKGIEFIRADLGVARHWPLVLKGVDTIFHLAAEVGVGQSMYEITRYMQANTMGTAYLLQQLVDRKPKLKRLVVASSMSIYGEGSGTCPSCGRVHPTMRPSAQLEARDWEVRCPKCGRTAEPAPTAEDTPLEPTSIYAISKRDQEEMTLSVCRAYGIPAVALRFFNVYGPRQALSNPYTGVGAIFSCRLLNDHPPLIFEDGRQSRDFIHVQDLVRGLILAMERDEAVGQAINLGTGKGTTVGGLAELLARKMGKGIAPKIERRFRAGDIRHCYADTAKARKLLGFEARIPLEEGCRDLIAWVKESSAEDRVDGAIRELEKRRLAR
jgi:dTDP-L-rhamnose 4-epimerase